MNQIVVLGDTLGRTAVSVTFDHLNKQWGMRNYSEVFTLVWKMNEMFLIKIWLRGDCYNTTMGETKDWHFLRRLIFLIFLILTSRWVLKTNRKFPVAGGWETSRRVTHTIVLPPAHSVLRQTQDMKLVTIVTFLLVKLAVAAINVLPEELLERHEAAAAPEYQQGMQDVGPVIETNNKYLF